jgi:hypothetical protein
MKKFLILMLLIPIGVHAEELERDYGPYDKEVNEEYSLIDYDDYVYTDYTDWTLEKKEVSDDLYEEKEAYEYKTTNLTNKILLTEFCNDNNYIDINNIKIMYEDEEVDYELQCTLCEENFEQKLKDGLARIRVNGTITLTLDDAYDTDKLRFIMNFIPSSTSTTWIIANYMNNDVINARNQIYKWPDVSTYDFDGSFLKPQDISRTVYLDEKTENPLYEYVDTVTMYRYREKLFHLYKEITPVINPASIITTPVTKKISNDVSEEITTSVEDLEPSNLVVTEAVTTNKVTEPINNYSNISSLVLNDDKKLTKAKEDKVEEKNYSFLLLFLLIPFLLLIKLILVLSKLYKSKSKNDNL